MARHTSHPNFLSTSVLKASWILAVTLWLLSACPQLLAEEPQPPYDFSGTWYAPKQSGHGVIIQTLDSGKAIVSWYTYTADGKPLWLMGLGTLEGNKMRLEMHDYEGGKPPTMWRDANPQQKQWGETTIIAKDCNAIDLSWESKNASFPSGSLNMVRLADLNAHEPCMAPITMDQTRQFVFERAALGFEAFFADLPKNHDNSIYELAFRHAELPVAHQYKSGLYLIGHNRSDDLLMSVTRAIDGLVPNTTYQISMEADVLTNTPSGCYGIGGPPGEAVFFKFGASSAKFDVTVDEEDNLRPNVDLGRQSNAGTHSIVVGDISNGLPCENEDNDRWMPKTLKSGQQLLTATTNSEGKLWVLAGTDSGFEGLTQYYITAIRLGLREKK